MGEGFILLCSKLGCSDQSLPASLGFFFVLSTEQLMGCLRYEGCSESRVRSTIKASLLLDLLEFLSIVEEVFGLNCKLQEFCCPYCVEQKGCRWNCWTESCSQSKSLHFLRIRYRFTLQISWTTVGNSGFSIVNTRGKIM